MIDFVAIPEKRMKILKKDEKLLKRLEEFVDVKVRLGEEVEIEGDDSLVVMCVKNVIKAFSRGFDFDDALLLLDENYLLDIVDVREYAGKSRNRMQELRGRVIGTKGRTKDIIQKLADVKIAVQGKTVCIIGRLDNVQDVRQAIEMLLQGRKQGSVYRFLEQKAETKLR
jgi:ribosomal RNA assembly protein